MAFGTLSFGGEANDTKNPQAKTQAKRGLKAASSNAEITNEIEYAELVKAEELRVAELKKGQNRKGEYKNQEMKKDGKKITETPDSVEARSP